MRALDMSRAFGGRTKHTSPQSQLEQAVAWRSMRRMLWASRTLFSRVSIRTFEEQSGIAFPTHLILTLAPAAFLEVAAGFPDFEPLPEIELPRDASPLGRAALSKEALE